MRRPTASRALGALALTGVLALAACTPPQGSASEDETSPSPSGSASESETTPEPDQSQSTDPGQTTRPTDEPQDDGVEGEAQSDSPFEYVRGLPAGVEEAPADTTGGVGWNEAGDALHVVTFGSSSCPLVPQTVESDGSGVEITLAAAGGAVCTMDYVPTYATVEAPTGLSSDAPVTAVLGDLGQVTVPAAATPTEMGWIAAEG